MVTIKAQGNEQLFSHSQEQDKHKVENAEKKKGTFFVGDLKREQDPIALKKQKAQKEAMKIVGDTFKSDSKIDQELASRADHVKELQAAADEAQKEVNSIANEKTKLKEEMGITEDSEQQQDLLLLEKRNEANKGNTGVELTKEDKERLSIIDKTGLSDYQTKALNYDTIQGVYQKEIEDAHKVQLEENAIIKGIKLGKLKNDPMISANEVADGIKDAASKEIIGEIVKEAKDKKEEEAKQEEEKVAKDKEDKETQEKLKKSIEEEATKQKIRLEEEASRSDTKTVNPNQLENPEKQSDNQDLTTKTIEEVSSVNTDIQKEVKNLIDSLKLLEEDIKGITVDTLL